MMTAIDFVVCVLIIVGTALTLGDAHLMVICCHEDAAVSEFIITMDLLCGSVRSGYSQSGRCKI